VDGVLVVTHRSHIDAIEWSAIERDNGFRHLHIDAYPHGLYPTWNGAGERHMGERTFRVWALFTDKAEDTGAIVRASSPNAALYTAAQRGIATEAHEAGRTRYLGLHAQEVTLQGDAS
jgi:hypothetical protein